MLTDFQPIEWAMQQTGMTVADVVAVILANGKKSKPAQVPREKSQIEKTAEFVNQEFDTRASDLVARGICGDTMRGNMLLSAACKSGLIDRIGHGVYAPKGTLSEGGAE